MSRIEEYVLRPLEYFADLIPGRLGFLFRAYLYRFWGCEIGQNVRIQRGVRFLCPSSISIGSNVDINYNVILMGNSKGSILIGDGCLLGPNSIITCSDHVISENIINSGHKVGSVILKENVLVSAACIITKDSLLGPNIVLGAGTVVPGKKLNKPGLYISTRLELKKSWEEL